MKNLVLLISFFCFLLSASFLQAQRIDCIDFSDQDTGTRYDDIIEGSIIAQYPSLANVSYEAFRNSNGALQTGIVQFRDFSNPRWEAPSLSILGAAVGFDLVAPASRVCFDANTNGGEIMLGINGALRTFTSWTDTEIADAFPDFNYSVEETSNGGILVCIGGFLQELVIGGQEIIVDNLCVDSWSSCLTDNLFLQTDCLNADTINLAISFEPSEEVENEFFDLYLDDEFYGFYRFDALPINVPVFWSAQNDEELYVRICENDNPDCCFTERIDLLPCVEAGCIGFELAQDRFLETFQAEDPLGMTYYVEQGVSFTVAEAYRNGSVLEDRDLIRFFTTPNSPSFPNGRGIVAGHQNVTSFIDLTGAAGRVTEITLDFALFGSSNTVLNFATNNQDIVETRFPGNSFLTEITFSDGSRVRIIYDRERPTTGTITFIGTDLRNVTVGGEEVMIDNFCLGEFSCNTRFVSLGQHACETNSDTALIYFDLRNFPNLQGRFDVLADGIGLGRFNYNDLPITHLPILASPGDTVVLSIVDVDFGGSCTLQESLYILPCERSCTDLQTEFIGIECEGFFEPTLILGLSSPRAGQEVIIRIPGANVELITTYGNNNLVISDPALVFADTLEIYDSLSDCTAFFSPAAYVDQNTCAECQIENIQVQTVGCNEEFYNLQIDFELFALFPAEDALFGVFINGENYGNYRYDQFPLSLGDIPYPPNQVEHEIVIEELVFGGCAANASFTVPCQAPCFDFQAEVVEVECGTEEGFNVLMNIEGAAPNTTVLIEDFFGNYEVEALVSEENLVQFSWPRNLGIGALRIISYANNCMRELDYNFERFCPGCELEEVLVRPTPCEGGRFNVGIQLFGGNPNEAYTIIVNGEVYIRDAVPRVVYFYGPTVGLTDDDLPLVIVVEGNRPNSDCRWVETVTESPCRPDCGDVFGEFTIACNDNGVAVLEFLAADPAPDGRDSFIVYVMNEVYAFEYGASSYRIELPYNATQQYEVIFLDPALNCEQVEIIDNPCFCFIDFDLVTATECATDGSYYINFSVTTGASWNTAEFIVEAGPYREVIPTGAFTTRLGPFFEPIIDLIVFERTRQLCVEQVRVESDCDPVECEIVELVAEATPCINGEYFIEGTFGARNTDGPFLAYIEGSNEVFTVSSEEPFRIGPFAADDFPQAILIVGAANSRCFAETVVLPDCEPGGACSFEDLVVEAYDCDGDRFLVDVAFRNPNGGDQGFYVFGNGVIYGPFQYNAAPFVTIGPLNGSQTNHNIMVLDIADPSCFVNYTLNYSCSDDCQISQVLTETVCDGEVFYVELGVAGQNLGETFTVVGNGQNYGVFSYADLPLNLGPFNQEAGTLLEFGVIDLGNPGCTNFTEVEAPNCLPCSISDLSYEVDCGNGFYSLTIDFSAENPRAERWLLEIDGNLYESFAYTDLPLTLDFDYPVQAIQVRDRVDVACVSELVEVDIPCCDLLRRDGQVRTSACESDGSFYLIVEEVTGTNLSDSLYVTYAPAGSAIVETMLTTYGSLPLEIGPLFNTGQTTYQVVLSDAVRECAQSYQVVAEWCDNSACVEFEGFDGIFGTNLGNEDGEVLYTENGVQLTFEEPDGECNCNLFGIPSNSVPDLNFGAGQGVFTQGSGFGLRFNQVETIFNTVNLDFYYPGGSLTLSVNDAAPVTVEMLQDLPATIAPSVSLQVTMDANEERLGVFTFSGEIESIEISTTLIAGFDNVCLSQDDDVWPGDGNYNGIADHYDLLNLGIAYGSTGPARNDASSEWSGFIAANWRSSFADGLNYKHADANGDGVVDAADREVLENNYGQVHGDIQEVVALPYTDIDPPVYVDLEEDLEYRAGGAFEIPVVAGSSEAEMLDVYGMAFTVQLDPSLIDLSTVEVVYPVSWFGDPEVNTMTIHRLHPDGRLEVALSRIDGNNVSGHGTVLYVRGLIDDIAGLSGQIPVYPDQVIAQNNNGIQLPVRPVGSMLTVTSTHDAFFDVDLLRESFTVFPNPTQEQIFFRNALQLPVDQLNVYTADGREVLSQKQPGNSVDLSLLPAGMYLLKVRIQGQVITERVIKTK